MNKNLLYLIGGVVVVGAVVFGVMMKPGAGPMGSSPEAQSGSMKELLASASPVQCTFTQTMDEASTEGTVYAANGRMRGDFTSHVAAMGQAVQSHMIIQNSEMQVWTDLTNQGMKMAIDMSGKQTANQNQQVPNLEDKLDYSCSPWAVDESKFTAPSNITFMSTMMPTGASVGSSGSMNVSAQCGACDQIPAGAAREQCKVSLQCK